MTRTERSTRLSMILGSIFFLMPCMAPSEIFAADKDASEIRERLTRIDERLTRVEERMVTKEELKAEIKEVREEIKDEIKNVRGEISGLRSDVRNEISSVRSEISSVRSDLKDFLLWGFGVTFAGIFTLIGFVLWDRRTALAPAIRTARELEEREERVERALKEIALKDAHVEEALRHAGILKERV